MTLCVTMFGAQKNQITKMTRGCNYLCMRCNHTKSVKLACVILLFEENDVTVRRTNISQATV